MSDRKTGNVFDTPLSRRNMLRLMGTATAGLMGFSLPHAAGAPSRKSMGKPNIIFILGDNHRADYLGCTGHPFIKTPNMDRLASEGVLFERTFNTTALCTPSRASFLTGCYASTHGVKNNHTPWNYRKTTFLEYLSKNGYDTAYIGKWHMPGKGLPDLPFLNLFVSYTYREGQGAYRNCPLIVNGKEMPSRKVYLSEEVTDWAIEFMERNRRNPDGSRKPFCIYLAHRPAHPPYEGPEGIAGMYRDARVQLPQGIDSWWYGKTDHNVFQGVMMGSYDKQLRKYCETITAMDRDIGRLLDRIDQSGLRENTVVIYMGDNGMMWGEHHLHGIKYPYEESIRLPLIVRIPWLVRDPGSRRTQIALNIDIGPTLLDLVGVSIPDDMEGVSLMPYLMNRKVSGRKAFLLEFWQYYPERCPTYFGVRTKTHKYVEFKKGWEPMLFDLTADPGESRNLYNTPEGEKILPELKDMLEKLKRNKKLR